jgi:Tfp pilus assembly protein PilX
MSEHEHLFQRVVSAAREHRTRAVKAAKAALNRDLREVNGLPRLQLVEGQSSDVPPSGANTRATREAIERAWDRYHMRIAAIWIIYETDVQKAQAVLDAANARIAQQQQHYSKQPKAITSLTISTPIFREPNNTWHLWRIQQMKRLFN